MCADCFVVGTESHRRSDLLSCTGRDSQSWRSSSTREPRRETGKHMGPNRVEVRRDLVDFGSRERKTQELN